MYVFIVLYNTTNIVLCVIVAVVQKMHLTQLSPLHTSIYKKRRCFLWKNQYFHIDRLTEENQEGCRGLIFMEVLDVVAATPTQSSFFLVLYEYTRVVSMYSY